MLKLIGSYLFFKKRTERMRFSILSFCCVIAFPSHWSWKISRTANVHACTRLKTLHSCCLTPICSYPSSPQSDLQLPMCIFVPQSTGPQKGMLREFLHRAVPAGRPGPLLGSHLLARLAPTAGTSQCQHCGSCLPGRMSLCLWVTPFGWQQSHASCVLTL